MDSNEKLEQPVVDSDSSIEQPNSVTENQTIKLQDGTEVTIDELKNGYMRQSDYTKKTTALAEEKKKNPELEETKRILQDLGFTTKEELEDLKNFKTQIMTEKEKAEQEKVFSDFTGKYKTLSESQKNIIKDLKKVYSDKSYDDILKQTGFIDQSLLEKSKGGGVVSGVNIGIPEPKKQEPELNPKIVRKLGLKPQSELEDIRNKFKL